MKRRLQVLFCVLTLLSLAFIFSNSLKNASSVETDKKRAVEVVEEVLETVTGQEIDLSRVNGAVIAKIGHVLEFSAFALFFSLSVYFSRDALDANAFYRIMFVCAFVAITDEHLQTLGKGRSSRVSDVMVDLSACLLGFALTKLLAWILKKKGKNDEGNLPPG